MNVLIGCEFSGIVRDAFTLKGHRAISCDLLPSERLGLHLQCDIRYIIHDHRWDLIIAHPPCTYLCTSGARWWKGREHLQQLALQLVMDILKAPCKRIALENPIGCISTKICKPTQIIQPWEFGHGVTKATCLWLKGLPKLVPTDIVWERRGDCHREIPSPERWRNRSRTYKGIAKAMADQWG